jgi:hypothetical protein
MKAMYNSPIDLDFTVLGTDNVFDAVKRDVNLTRNAAKVFIGVWMEMRGYEEFCIFGRLGTG